MCVECKRRFPSLHGTKNVGKGRDEGINLWDLRMPVMLNTVSCYAPHAQLLNANFYLLARVHFHFSLFQTFLRYSIFAYKTELLFLSHCLLSFCIGLLCGDFVSHWNGCASSKGPADSHVVPESHLPSGFSPERSGPVESKVSTSVSFSPCSLSQLFSPPDCSHFQCCKMCFWIQVFPSVPLLVRLESWVCKVGVFAPLSRGGVCSSSRPCPHSTVMWRHYSRLLGDELSSLVSRGVTSESLDTVVIPYINPWTKHYVRCQSSSSPGLHIREFALCIHVLYACVTWSLRWKSPQGLEESERWQGLCCPLLVVQLSAHLAWRWCSI